MDFEAQIVAKFDSLSRMIEETKCKLLECVTNHVNHKSQVLKDQSNLCKEKLKNTTGLLQYTFEVLKENDPAGFLTVSLMFQLLLLSLLLFLVLSLLLKAQNV